MTSSRTSTSRGPLRVSPDWMGILLTLSTVLIAPGLVAQNAPGMQEPPPDVTVQVGGLSCPFCAYGIEKKFLEREEVDSVFVALGEGEVRLWIQPGEELTDEEARQTVEDAGFTPGEIRRLERGEARRSPGGRGRPS